MSVITAHATRPTHLSICGENGVHRQEGSLTTVETKEKAKTSANSQQPSERELKQKERRQVRLKASALGKGGAEYLGVIEAIAGRQDPEASNMWVQLFKTCVDDPGEWYNRKFYYPEERDSNSHSSIASFINKQGHIREEAAEYKSVWCQKLRELSKLYGGEFQAEYTSKTVKSDAPHKGAFMNIMFVRFVKVAPKVALKDAMAVHSSRRD